MLGMLCPPLPRWNAKTEARRVLLQQVRLPWGAEDFLCHDRVSWHGFRRARLEP